MKWRNSKERELLANGGSRDQTLPNKNNPNPDLSDAKTDRPQSLSPSSSPALDGSQTSLQSHQNPQNNQNQTPGKSPEQDKKSFDQKFLQINKKFDLMASPSNTSKSSGDFKYEKFDVETQLPIQPIGQIFNSFYDNHSSNESSKLQNQQNNQMFYDEYSDSDSDEEINVT